MRWWVVLLLLMTGDRCHRQRKMMGRGADGGCGTEERPCPVSRVPAKNPASQPEIEEKQRTSPDIDLYSQARKALSERSPFDAVPEENSALSLLTLPSGLASFLWRSSDSRRRHKKSHSGADKKSARPSRGSNIWVETEEYFRDLTLPDIEALYEVSSPLSSLVTRKCFLIPFLENDPRASVGSFGNESVNEQGVNEQGVNEGGNGNGNGDGDGNENGDGNGNGDENENENENGNGNGNENGNEDGNVNGVVKEEEVKSEAEQAMEIDTVGADVSPQDEKSCSVSASPGGLEWLLGTRNKISLTSERPSKKRRLLGSDAGLEKVLIACPCEGNSSLCHFCCMGDTGKESNQLIVCSLCKVAVHQKCYGVQEDVDESWLCAWCKQMSDSNDSVKPCMLCPKQGGALKPIHKTNENDGALEFAHLFCCHWMPEVYIEDLKKMEPIMNVGGIKETRRKLVCNVCKVKCGACVRCSHGTCRTSFHPLCAREARLRMEVWGKYGCDNVELRAFCPKHSDVQSSSSTSRVDDPTLAVGGDSNVANHLPVAVSLNKLHKSKIDCQNGENIAVHIGTPDATSNKSGDSGLQERGFSSSGLNTGIMSDCGDAQQLINVGTLQRSTEDVNLSDSLNVALILKKLIDRGKTSVKDVALDIGISPDSLTATLADDGMVPELRCKILKWLRNHTYISTLEKNLKVKANSEILCKGQGGTTDGSDALAVSDSNNPDSVAVKSVPPRRRTKSNVRILKDSKVICSPEEFFSDNGIMIVQNKVDQFASEETEKSSNISIPNATEKNSTEADGIVDSLLRHSPKSEGNSDRPSNYSFPGRVHLEDVAICEQKASVNGDQGNPVCSTVNSVVSGVMKTEAVSSFYIHPCICKKLLQMEWVMLSKHPVEFNGPRGREISRLEASSTASVCCNHQNQLSKCNNKICNSDGLNLEQLAKAREMGVLDLSPKDEVEGEIVYFQHRLLSNAAARKQFTDNLICNVAQSLPREIDAARWQRWDSVLVNQYLCELREAKKQGRKERKHKEAQAVLAAATAAAAASSRISSFRKDAFDDSAQQESLTNLITSNGRSGISSQLMPRVTETLPRVAPRVSSERQSDFVHSVSDLSKENPRSCDICRRSETILNPILVCLSCKVAVHLDCYRSVKESTGPWCCELCEDLSSRSSGATPHNFWEKPYFVAECGLCGGTAGAFRKSSNGEWVHAFCAEWVFESTFRRGQVNPIEGMETVLKEAHACYICRRKHGVCIKCNFGHCQITFHPTCARSSGFYMNIKNYGGKLQHKAYCEKHSLEQRAKAETHEHGIEEFKKFKQIRVELERLRLICERIIRREKKKRELVLCSHDILSFRRDQIARTLLAHNPFFLPDVSSESATTSLKGHTDDYKSCSDAIQRSDDITVDSTASVKRRIKVPVSMDTDQKTDDDCSTSHVFFTRKLTERSQCSGKQIPQKPSSVASRNLSDEGGWRSKYRKHAETFEKEIIMTSDQASMKNMRLPKGYQYVPADILHSGEQINQDASSSGEPLERHE